MMILMIVNNITVFPRKCPRYTSVKLVISKMKSRQLNSYVKHLKPLSENEV